MVAHAAGEREALAVAPEPQQILGRMEVLRANDLLLDDRPFIKVGGDVMAGGADELDAAVVGAAVGVGADEGREEGVVNVDDPARMAGAERGGKDLHVAGEDNELGAGRAQRALDFGKGGLLCARRDGDVAKLDSLPLDHAA